MIRLTRTLLLAASLTLLAGAIQAQNNNPVLRIYQLTTELTTLETISAGFNGSLESAGIKYTVDDADGDFVTVSVALSGVTSEGILDSHFFSSGMGYYERNVTSNNQAFFSNNNTFITVVLTATDNSAWSNSVSFQYTYRVETGGGPPVPAAQDFSNGGGCVSSGVPQAPWWMLATMVVVLTSRRALKRRRA